MFKLSIKTTQNISLFFTPASVGERILARLIDIFIQSGYLVMLYYIFYKSDVINLISMDTWSEIAFFIIITAPATLYPLICESLMSGQTLGKKVLNIRVIKIDGYQASFYDYAIRWFFGIIETTGFFSIIGLISLITSKYTQRLGDFAAGVAVITLNNKTNISHTILTEIEESYQPYFLRSQILSFSDNDVQIIKNYYDQSRSKQKRDIIGKLCQKIEEISGRTNTDMTPLNFVEKFLKDYNYYTKE